MDTHKICGFNSERFLAQITAGAPVMAGRAMQRKCKFLKLRTAAFYVTPFILFITGFVT